MKKAAAEYPPEVDEFREVRLTPVNGEFVRSPLVDESPVNMECRLTKILEFGESPNGGHVIIGEVMSISKTSCGLVTISMCLN